MKKWIYCLCVAGLVMGCFQVRPVEPPNSTRSEWVAPTDYTILLDNLKTAIARRNTQNYLRCFNDEGLQFSPAASLFNNNESIWRAWSIQDEQGYFDNMKADLAILSGNSLSLIEKDLQGSTIDSLRYVGDYTLRINHPDSTLSTLFQGQVQFIMKINTFNEWSIDKWEDIETHPDSSWSLLKLTYVQ